MNIGICGITGRMGLAIMRMLVDRGHTLGAAFDREDVPWYGKTLGPLVSMPSIHTMVGPITSEHVAGVDGLIDFSAPAATKLLLPLAVRHRKPIVIGTTGITDEGVREIHDAARSIPVLFSPNMSVGVNLLFKLTEIAARALQSGFDVEVFEAHHRHKKDAPSGTALKLVEIVKKSIPALAGEVEKHGRVGITGERPINEVGVHAMRGGDIVGEHTVFFAGTGERIELTHRAISRDPLANGAVIGMEYIAGKDAGLYTMFDVLGF